MGQGGRGQGGDLGVVVGRGHLHHVEADQVEIGQRSHDLESLVGRQAAGHRGTGPGSVGRIEAVDIEGQVGGIVSDHPSDVLDHGSGAVANGPTAP